LGALALLEQVCGFPCRRRRGRRRPYLPVAGCVVEEILGNKGSNEVAVFVCASLFHLKHFPHPPPFHEPSLKSHHPPEKWAPCPEMLDSSQDYVSWQKFTQKNEKNQGKEVQEAHRRWKLSNPSCQVDVQEKE
jgi:hypothetical protein